MTTSPIHFTAIGTKMLLGEDFGVTGDALANQYAHHAQYQQYQLNA
jgi:hypothetical protein